MGLKEKAIVAVLLVVVLYAAAGATWFMYSERAWSKAKKQYEETQRKLEEAAKSIPAETELIEEAVIEEPAVEDAVVIEPEV